MSDPTKIHVHTSDDGPCGYCSGVDCPMRYCPGCPPGCALAEDEPGEDHSDVRSVSPARGPERPESVERAALGATNSPSGYPSDPPALKGPQNRVERVSDAEAAEWARLADAATEGPWRADGPWWIDGPSGRNDPHAKAMVSGPGRVAVMVPERWDANDADAAFIASARTAVPRLLAEREALTTELAEARATIARLNARAQVAEAAIAELTGTGKGKAKRVAREVWTRCEDSHGQACRTTQQARDLAAALEAENARLREGIERLASMLDTPAHRRPPKAPRFLNEAADDLRALLADTDGAKDEGGDRG